MTGSPSERCGLQLNDEIMEVNGINVERASHHEIIVQIHNSKKKIVLTIKRTKGAMGNGKFGFIHLIKISYIFFKYPFISIWLMFYLFKIYIYILYIYIYIYRYIRNIISCFLFN